MTTPQNIELIAAIGQLLTASAALMLGLIIWREERSERRAQIQDAVNRLYDQVVTYRKDAPEVLKLSRLWQASSLDAAYLQRNDEERNWAIYYGYVELCLSYCYAVIHAHDEGIIARRALRDQHENLAKLLLTENYPAVRQFTDTGKYISPRIGEFMSKLAKGGWSWERQHELLVSEGTQG